MDFRVVGDWIKTNEGHRTSDDVWRETSTNEWCTARVGGWVGYIRVRFPTVFRVSMG